MRNQQLQAQILQAQIWERLKLEKDKIRMMDVVCNAIAPDEDTFVTAIYGTEQERTGNHNTDTNDKVKVYSGPIKTSRHDSTMKMAQPYCANIL